LENFFLDGGGLRESTLPRFAATLVDDPLSVGFSYPPDVFLDSTATRTASAISTASLVYSEAEVTVALALAGLAFTLLLTFGDTEVTDEGPDTGLANCFCSISIIELLTGTTTEGGCIDRLPL